MKRLYAVEQSNSLERLIVGKTCIEEALRNFALKEEDRTMSKYLGNSYQKNERTAKKSN